MAEQDSLALRLRIAPETPSFRPGAVVLLTVTGSKPIISIEGNAFKHALRFWPTAAAGDWQALVGVPIDTSPGSYEMAVRAKDADGRTSGGQLPLTIARSPFETRRLTVDPRFVEPPASELERIKREAKTLADIFVHVTPGRLWNGPFAPPVPGSATSSFGRLTILNGVSRTRHLGTDFRAAEGTPVVAPNAGKVVLADDYYFSGNTVILDHGDGLYSLIAHLSRVGVKPGALLQRGDRVGDSGATGRVTGPHLHWAVRLESVSVDPLSLMTAVAAVEERH
jgi:murein DD-endopeptidase MepM/ murein hydrolase activator NlpD